MIIKKLAKQGVIHPPRWLPDNTMYLCEMGSVAYGVSGETSDIDVHGFCIPPRHIVFPHLDGVIPGFGTQPETFNQWQQHHVKQPGTGREYDFAIYSIVSFFHNCMKNNPHALDALFAPRRCILHMTELAAHLRTNRRMFLHKGAIAKLRGYANSQVSKLKNGVNALTEFMHLKRVPFDITDLEILTADVGSQTSRIAHLTAEERDQLQLLFEQHELKKNPKRAASIVQHGLDVKFAYHIVRLCLQCEQILSEHDLNIQRNSEVLKAIRRGEWSMSRVIGWFEEKELALEALHGSSTLRADADEAAIKQLLMECLERHYGSLAATISTDVSAERVLDDLRAVLDRYTPPPPLLED